MENFRTFRKAHIEATEQRREASEQTDKLNPKGKPSPIFTEMKELFDTLGTTPDDERLQVFRTYVESWLDEKALRVYNTYLQGKKGSPTHHEFHRELKSSFLHGFDLYLKTYLRLDAKDAPQRHEPYYASTGGGGKMRVTDERSEEEYQRDYIIAGSAVRLPLKPDEHQFDRSKEVEGYTTKYQAIAPEDSKTSALANYMFEKFRIYTKEFYSNLTLSLEAGIDLDTSIEMAQYAYGTEATLIAEMEPYGLTPEEVAEYSIFNRTRARYGFEAFKEVGARLEQEYPYKDDNGKRHRWVRNQKMIRNLIFRYPSSVESGLRVVDTKLDELTSRFPDVPQEMIINICIASPDDYEMRIREVIHNTDSIMSRFAVPNAWLPGYSGTDHLLAYYGLVGEGRRLIRKAGKGATKDLEYIIKEADTVIQKLTPLAEAEGSHISFQVIRRILRSFLLKNASVTKVLAREQKQLARQLGQNEDLYVEAEALDPLYGHFYVDVGFGTNGAERLEIGQYLTNEILQQYGATDGEVYLQGCVDAYYRYIDAGFPQDTESLNHLKDALVMDPNNTRDFYETTLKQMWPENIEEFKASPSF